MKRAAVLLLLVVLAAGCAPAEEAAPDPTSTPFVEPTAGVRYEMLEVAGVDGPVRFARQNAQTDVLEALMVGELTTDEDGCVRLATGEEPGFVPVWPPGFTLEAADGPLAVRDPDGQPLVLLGDTVSLSGGEASPDDAALDTLGCPGPYWIVGAEVEPYVP